jgi:hypothetical protein
MKIGLSYSRCLRDIVDGAVSLDDLLVIITRTNFDPRNTTQWETIWNRYTNRGREWSAVDHAQEPVYRSLSIELYESGKLHQPRKFGYEPTRLPYYWLETIVWHNDLENLPAVKDAWQRFQTVAGLMGVPLDKEHHG